MNVQTAINIAETHTQLRLAEIVSIKAHMNALWKMGLYVEREAVVIVTKNTGRLAQSIKTLPPTYNKIYHWIEVVVVADVHYSIYVEMGFAGHFVPFDRAPELYAEALQRWGFRPPAGNEYPKNRRPDRRYLVPPNKRKAVWGVYIDGTAKPFLTPALGFVDTPVNRDRILAEEFNKAYAELARTVKR